MSTAYDPSGNLRQASARFPKDVEKFEMRILADSGIIRVLDFSASGTCINSFTITTWPGILAITGDMGSYVFQRLPDMFEFFRPNPKWPEDQKINPQYWAEKVVAEDRHCKLKAFSSKKFEDIISERVKEIEDAGDLSKREMKIFRREVEDALLGDRFSSCEEAYEEAGLMQLPDGREAFPDFGEHDLTDYGYHYLWCIMAIVWAIEKYDAHGDSGKQLITTGVKE